MKRALNTDIVPLVRAIATDNAVVFVGAGASMDAGLPSWNQFLKECLERAELHRDSNDKLNSVRERIESGDFLLAAEILQNVLESDLPHLIRERFAQSNLRPTEIHEAISGMNFPLAITTNYDRLQELAYPETAQTLTWQRAEDILLFMRERRFAVVKIHGDVSNQSSLVLTRTNYRKLMHLNAAFKICMKTLLLTKTFIFVGCSLRDHDLLSLIDEARSEFDSGFGPHYAILLKNEADKYLAEALRDCYRINVITIDPDEKDGRFCSLSGRKLPSSPISSIVADYLTEISGRVAIERLGKDRQIPVYDSLFSLRSVVDSRLRKVTQLCGSQRAEICLVDPAAESKKAIYREGSFSVHEGKTRFFDPSVLIDLNTIQGRLFLQRKVEKDFIYVSNLDEHKEELRSQGYEGLNCNQSHNDSESLLACPIYSDGRRSGIISVEAERKRAFSEGHLLALKEIAREIGWAQYEARHRRNSSTPLKNYASNMPSFVHLLNQSRLLREFDLMYLLYAIDVYNGKVDGYYVDEESGEQCDEPFTFSFNEESLAIDVLRNRKKTYFEDADKAVKDGFISDRGVKKFGIKGPIFGLPIHCHGIAAGVLVCWAKNPEIGLEPRSSNQTKYLQKFEQAVERTRRMAHLIANDPIALAKAKGVNVSSPVSADSFVEVVNKKIGSFRGDLLWDISNYKDPTFRREAMKGLLSCLVAPSCGLRRARLWLNAEDGGFVCVHSINREDSVRPNRKLVDEYAGTKIPSGDPFGEYIKVRSKYDPYARVMEESMLGDEKELLGERLDKASGSPWIIAPITSTNRRTRNVELLGFIAADNHYWHKETDSICCEPMSEDMNTYHRYCIDEVTDILEAVVRSELNQRKRDFKASQKSKVQT